MSGLAFAAGAAKGVAGVTQDVMDADIQMIRDNRMNEFKKAEAEIDRLFRSQQAEIDREFRSGEAEKQRGFTGEQAEKREEFELTKSEISHDRQMTRDERQSELRKQEEAAKSPYKHITDVDPEFDPYTGSMIFSGGQADKRTGVFTPYTQAAQVHPVHIQRLQANKDDPYFVKKFEEKYGQGSASRYIGQVAD